MDVFLCRTCSHAVVSSWVIRLFGLSQSCEVPCRKSQHEQPTVFLRQVWPSISCSGCAHWGCREGLLGFWKERRGFMYSNRSIFCETLWLLHFSFQLASCSLGSFVITRYIYQSSSRAPFIFQVFQLGSPFNGNFRISSGTVGDLVRDRGPWFQVGRHRVYLLPGPIITAACRRVATESLHLRRKCANEDWSTLPPTHPRSPYPDKGKPFTGSDGARHLQGSLVLHSFRIFVSFHSVFLSLPLCHLASVFGGRLHKRWTALTPGKAKEFNWKGDPEWKLPFLFRPLFCESTEMYQGKEDEMYRRDIERNRSCS